MDITIYAEVRKVEGPNAEEDDITIALTEELEGFEFEAGDEPTVYEITSVAFGRKP